MKCPHCKKSITGLSFEKRKQERLDLIMSSFDERITIRCLYRKIKRSKINKYTGSLTQFERDILSLEGSGNINILGALIEKSPSDT